MRIGIDASCWSNNRGFGRFTRELVNALVGLRAGDEFVLFADQQTAAAGGFPAGCKVVAGKTGKAATQAAAANGRRSIGDMWAMRRAVSREPLDVMFFPAVYSYFPVGGPVPCIVTFHDVIAETLPHLVFTTRRSRLFWNLKSRLALWRSSTVVTVSEASKQGLMRFYGLPESRVRVISEAASEPFASLRGKPRPDDGILRRHGLEAEQRYLLYVGGISPHKNLDTLISAFAAATREPELADVQLVLVGDHAGDVFRTCYDQLCRLVEGQGVRGRVRFAGFVPDAHLVHLFAGAQAFVFPSYLEGFGLSAVEAMACGTAVLASNRGSLPEVLNGAGELFDPQSVESLAGAMRRVLSDDSFRSELEARSQRRGGEFSWDRSAREVMQVVREVVSSADGLAGRPTLAAEEVGRAQV